MRCGFLILHSAGHGDPRAWAGVGASASRRETVEALVGISVAPPTLNTTFLDKLCMASTKQTPPKAGSGLV